MRPPRGLYGEFPLGRPLGRPHDAPFQHRVLGHALSLLSAPEGPVLVDFPHAIDGDAEPALACPVPPASDGALSSAAAEARGLRSAYERTMRASKGRTNVGRVVDADGVADALERLHRVAEGTSWKEAGMTGDSIQLVHDVRAYYDEAALALVDRAPGAGEAEKWFFESTEAGKLVLATRARLKDDGAPFAMWYYMAGASR